MEAYLEECLDSIVCQTIDSLEILAINDGSTDGTLDILTNYAKKYKNIIIHTQLNQGQAVAKNYGILNANGEYVVFMDPDDYYPDRDCLQKLYECAVQYDVPICAGLMFNDVNGCKSITDKDVADKYYKNMLVDVREYNDIYHHQRFIFRREFLINNNILFPEYRRYEDPPFTINALSKAKFFYGMDVPVYVHRIGYKRVKLSIDNCIDIMKGIGDVIEICKDNYLDKVYERVLKGIIQSNIIPFYGYTFSGNEELDKAFERTNSLLMQWKGKEFSQITKENVIKMRKKCLKNYKKIYNILTRSEKVLLYGAGGITNNFLDIFSNCTNNIIGIAVTATEKKYSIGSYKVSSIDDYVDLVQELVVMITTLEKYQDEIYDNLLKKGFSNIVKVDIRQLYLAETILDKS